MEPVRLCLSPEQAQVLEQVVVDAVVFAEGDEREACLLALWRMVLQARRQQAQYEQMKEYLVDLF